MSNAGARRTFDRIFRAKRFNITGKADWIWKFKSEMENRSQRENKYNRRESEKRKKVKEKNCRTSILDCIQGSGFKI